MSTYFRRLSIADTTHSCSDNIDFDFFDADPILGGVFSVDCGTCGHIGFTHDADTVNDHYAVDFYSDPGWETSS